MYFNLDYQKKQNILKYYKKEADEHRRKKEEEKNQKIQEEINYIQQIEQNQYESDKKISEENNRKKKAIMREYLEMLQKTKNDIPGYHYSPKNREVIINNWGKTKEEYLKENKNNIYNKNKYNNKSIDISSFKYMSPIRKEKLDIKPIDTMSKFLTDDINNKEIESYLERQKENKKNYYKDLLYSQYNDSASKNKNRFGTEDYLLMSEKKKKLITENPYREKNVYGFGNTNLENNPIVNPDNNMRYNKYIKNFYLDISSDINGMEKNSNINDKINSNNSNDYYNKNFNNVNHNVYKNIYNNQKNENNLAINGSNIMNNYKIDISKYKNNNDDLSRNFNDIYKNILLNDS